MPQWTHVLKIVRCYGTDNDSEEVSEENALSAAGQYLDDFTDEGWEVFSVVYDVETKPVWLAEHLYEYPQYYRTDVVMNISARRPRLTTPYRG